MMSPERFTELRDDILAHGLLQPIITFEDKILDGRNRYEACIDLEIDITDKTEPYTGTTPYCYVWSRNGQRRDLVGGVRAAIYVKIEGKIRDEIKAQVAAEANIKRREASKEQISAQPRDDKGRVKPGGAISTGTTRTKKPNRSSAVSAKAAGVDRFAYESQKQLRQARPDLADKVAENKLKPAAAMKAFKRDARAEQIATAAAEAQLDTDRVSLHLLPCIRLTEVAPDNSVDWIITDPPYPEEFLDCFSELSDVAARVLKPGGSLLCMSGQSYLPEVMERIGTDLTYQWTLAYLTPGGQAVQIFPRKVNTFWKPILWYVKGTYEGDWIGDVTKSDVNDNDKTRHEWGQSESGMHDLMRRFVRPGHTVVDPFLGAGTTGVIAIMLGAKFIGLDINEQALNEAKSRLGQSTLSAAA